MKKKKKSYLLRKVIGKKVLKQPKKLTVVVKESKPAEYVSRYFNEEWEETKKSLFFK